MREKIVVALGGNALQSKESDGTAEAQLKVVKDTCKVLADLSAGGYEMAIVHGNGPQVGRILLASETAGDVVPPMPLEVCGAMSEGYIGYHIQQALRYELARRGMAVPVCTVATQVVVDADDPSFKNPTKPIGPFYDEAEAKKLEQERGFDMREDAARGGWRRVVASPKPQRIVEIDPIRIMWDKVIVICAGGGGIPVIEHADARGGWRRVVASPKPQRIVEIDPIRIMWDKVIVICAGGGGIPVIEHADGRLSGAAAVIDKDFAAELLAEEVKADALIILTEVEKVAINFGTPDQVDLDHLSLEEAAKLCEEGQFGSGSMLPKVEACMKFVRANPDKKAIITSLAKAQEALAGETGTVFTFHR